MRGLQSSGMSPIELSIFTCVVDRAYQKDFDEKQGIEPDENDRVHEVHLVISNWHKGKSAQNACSTEGALRKILLDHYVQKGFINFDGKVCLVTDKCSAQYRCADRFAMNVSWVNPMDAADRAACKTRNLPALDKQDKTNKQQINQPG